MPVSHSLLPQIIPSLIQKKYICLFKNPERLTGKGFQANCFFQLKYSSGGIPQRLFDLFCPAGKNDPGHNTADNKKRRNYFCLGRTESKKVHTCIYTDLFDKESFNSVQDQVKSKQGSGNCKFFPERPEYKK